MTQNSDVGPDGGSLTPSQVKGLKYAIAGMSLMIVVGLGLVVGRIIYLGSGGGKQAGLAAGAVRSGPIGALAERAKLPLPPQAVVRHVALNQDRMVVQFDSPAGAGIVVFDLASGNVVSRVEIVPEVPR
jgi:hypothetical protein